MQQRVSRSNVSPNPEPTSRARRGLWRRLLTGGAVLSMLWAVAARVSADNVAPSVEVACVILRDAAYAGAIVGHPLSGRYDCTASGTSIFALRYHGPENADGSSNLVGYYKVSLSSGTVHEWDLGAMRVGRLVFTPRRKASAPK
jgi:hypothetical protein